VGRLETVVYWKSKLQEAKIKRGTKFFDLVSQEDVEERLVYYFGKWVTLKEPLSVVYDKILKAGPKWVWTLLPGGVEVQIMRIQYGSFLDKKDPERNLIVDKNTFRWKAPWAFTTVKLLVSVRTHDPILLPKADPMFDKYGEAVAYCRLLDLYHSIEPEMFGIIERYLGEQRFIEQGGQATICYAEDHTFILNESLIGFIILGYFYPEIYHAIRGAYSSISQRIADAFNGLLSWWYENDYLDAANALDRSYNIAMKEINRDNTVDKNKATIALIKEYKAQQGILKKKYHQ
jgi:hypothetical protein